MNDLIDLLARPITIRDALIAVAAWLCFTCIRRAIEWIRDKRYEQDVIEGMRRRKPLDGNAKIRKATYQPKTHRSSKAYRD